jgi:hypothetical protein
VWIEEYIFLRSSSDTMGWCSVVPFALALSSVMAVLKHILASINALSLKLNDVLKHCYLSARKADGEMYKVNTLESTRYSLNKYLKSPTVQKTFDIIKDNAFIEANMCFKTAITELKDIFQMNGLGKRGYRVVLAS